ncbi:MAG: hypothetical protein VXW25_09860, partial [Pseudomonadota bacterium]|nr:hypothetical protein [Pseudomonadota bacterium]
QRRRNSEWRWLAGGGHARSRSHSRHGHRRARSDAPAYDEQRAVVEDLEQGSRVIAIDATGEARLGVVAVPAKDAWFRGVGQGADNTFQAAAAGGGGRLRPTPDPHISTAVSSTPKVYGGQKVVKSDQRI